MAKPVIITCAPTGGIHTPTMSDHLPITPDEIATASIEAARPAPRSSIFTPAIRNRQAGPRSRPVHAVSAADQAVDRRGGQCLDRRRSRHDPRGTARAATRAQPEMASLNVGSMNFGIFPMANKYSEWKLTGNRSSST